MRVSGIIHGSRANGPRLRSCVWLTGCSLGCEGCQNPKLWDFNGGFEIDPDTLAARIIWESAKGTVGLTISGGEPMHQARSVNDLMCSILARRPEWDIGLFTGYTLREVTSGQYDLREPIPNLGTQQHARACLWEYSIRERLTWAVFGRYDRTRPVTDTAHHHRLCSSENQMMTMFKRRWTYDEFLPLTMEVNIENDGLVKISGFPAIQTNDKGEQNL